VILVIDNYDSFTYNLVQYLGELGEEIVVHRNDKVMVDEIRAIAPDRIVISPGPGRPDDAGISKDVIRTFAGEIPILGVCLGHQCIAEVYGSSVVRSDLIMHGKVSDVFHDGKDIFKDVPTPFTATRYHSLIVDRESVKPPIEVTAWTKDKEIMGIRHNKYPIWGVQFHPESILTVEGKKILKNFIKM